MLISEIEANTGFGRDLFKEPNPEDIINLVIEFPLRKACRIFFEKNIKTVMSSANKHNIVNNPEEVIEKKDVIKNSLEFMTSSTPPTFEDAGKGYAWIMLDFDSLSDENKDWILSLEARKSPKGESIGEKGIWFVQPCVIGNLDHKIKIGAYTYDQLKELLDESEIPEGIEYDKRLAEFEKRRILLAYNNRYPCNVVILRYPIDKDTTVSEVEEYFAELANSFKTQEKENLVDDNIKLKENKVLERIEQRELDIH